MADIPQGQGKEFVVGDRIVAVFHAAEGAVWALEGVCPHAGGPLGNSRSTAGNIEGGVGGFFIGGCLYTPLAPWTPLGPARSCPPGRSGARADRVWLA